MAREKGNFKFAANLEVKKGAPLDPRVVVNTKAELLSKDTWPVDGDIVYLYNGLLVAVLEDDNNIYQLIDADNYSASDYSAWKKVGGSTGGLSIGTDTSGMHSVSELILGTGLSFDQDNPKNIFCTVEPNSIIRITSGYIPGSNTSMLEGIGLNICTGLSFSINQDNVIDLYSAVKIGTNTSYNITKLILSTEYSLGYTSDSKLAILLGSGLSRKGETGEIQINLGSGLTLAGDKIAVLYPQQFLDVGTGLKYSNDNTIIFDAASGSGLYPDNGGIYIETKIREVTTDSFKTINGNSILGSGDIEINTTLGASDFINGGVINITTTGDIEEIYNSLDTGAIALCIIGDSSGSYPSSETRVNVNSAYTVSANYFFSEDARGANVGDMLMITKQTYLLINRCALKIIPINDSKVATDEYTGTDGIMTVWDKTRINKVDGIEWTANDTRAWLNSVVNTDLRKTKYGYGTALEDCIKTGALAYTGAEIAGINANWTIFVDCTTDTDGGGYYHVIQTAICRDEAYLGRIWKRFGYYTSSTAPEFLEWKEITNTGLEARIAALEAQISSMTTETEV